MITLHTNYGDIDIELDFDKAPISSANFLQYCRDNFYNETIFHRVIEGFMLQGGGMNTDMSEKTTRAAITNEADNGLSNDIGTLAMARTNVPDSASSQFFINIADNHFLNHTAKTPQGWGYAVFGKVVSGMDIVDKIKQVSTGSSGHHQDVPVELVIIERTSISDDYTQR
ncbi:MAG: peptidyl-prolyl cis-trans isomerase [Gammaproteobacteria bacterium]|nr:MAG: peptidyl-prolyl cis-trans isomerase [Gammaproteobacteria bacterium]RLA51411.1 MAG: peptidyl-prolyl cis-trans isomerase [Gammaproteobacteria bacterium]